MVDGFGRLALLTRDVDVVAAGAVEAAMGAAATPMGTLAQSVRPGWVRMTCARGPTGLTRGHEYEVSPLVESSWETARPLRVENWDTCGLPRPADMIAAGVVASLSASVLVGGRVWGRLTVCDTRVRQWRDEEAGAIAELADVLAAAVERHVVEAAQAAVARFGRFALASRDLDALNERAVEVVTQALGTPMGTLSEWAGGGRRRMLCSRGPTGVAVGQVWDVAVELDSLAAASEPVCVEDWRTEQRFTASATSRAAGVVSSLLAPVLAAGRAWAFLVAHDTRPRQWTQPEVDVVQSVAHILATAVQRRADEAAQSVMVQFGRFALTSRDLDEVIEQAVTSAMRLLQAPIGSLSRGLGSGRQRMLFCRGDVGLLPGHEWETTEELEKQWFTAQPVLIEDWQTETRFVQPQLSREMGVRSALLTTVSVGGEPWGRLAVSDTRPRRWRQVDVDVVQSLADLLSSALERDLAETAQAAMAEFGRFALSTRDLDVTIDEAAEVAARILDASTSHLTRLVAPGRAQVVGVYGPYPVRIGGEVAIPAELEQQWSVSEPFQVRDWRVETRYPQPASASAAGVVSSLSVCVLADGAPWGRLTVFDTRPRHWCTSEVNVVQALAHTLASAIERARAETRLRRTTRQLEHFLLPADLPTLSGIETAARYVPAHGAEVGGDWYDVLDLPHGGIGLVMGDVEGHDSAAAAVVGQVRTVLRTYAGEGLPPAEIMSRLGSFVTTHTDRLVTCCYAELHPTHRTITCVSAGHPPPLLLTTAGEVPQIPVHPGPLLGLDGSRHYRERTTVLPTGGCLVLYTDGLLDDFPHVIHPDPRSLAAAAHPALHGPIEALADHLVAHPLDAPPLRDDAALLLVRFTGTNICTTRHLSRGFGPHLASCGAARSYVEDVLSAWGLTCLAEQAMLAVSELVGNTLTHTTSPVWLALRRTRSNTGVEQVWIGVRDASDRLPRLQRSSAATLGGRGLHIVEAIADTWGVTTTQTGGKTVWIQLAAPPTSSRPAAIPARRQNSSMS
ncbi:MAG TPA: GAF domain-containing protein [Kineosporiaceae bacterium]